MSSLLKRFQKPLALLGFTGLTAMAMGVAQPASAATVSCQAIDATSIIGGTIPSPACSSAAAVGDTFEIDFSSVFNSTDFSTANTYSLQLANLDTVLPQSTLDFSNVELLITGSFQPQSGPPVNFTTPTAISIWQATGQTGQGFSNYVVNGSGQNFGVGTAYKSANFSLTAPNAPTFGTATAGLINTIPLNLASVGVTSFTSAKIRGVLLSSNTAVPQFSAGLGIFTTNSPFTGVPNIIYGNAFNEVPGPLPIFGAGAAFGMSRKLRRRIGASKAAA